MRFRSALPVLFGLFVASPALAQPAASEDLADLRKRLIAERWDLLVLQARHELLERAGEMLLDPRLARDKPGHLKEEDGWNQLLKEHLAPANAERLKVLKAQEEKLEERQEQARAAWREALETELRFREDEAAAEARLGSLRARPPANPWFDTDILAILGGGVLLFLVGVLLGRHALRRHLRRKRRFAVLLFLFVCGLPLAAAFADSPEESWYTRQAKELEKEIKEARSQEEKLAREVKSLEAKVTQARRELVRRWAAPFSEKGEGYEEQFARDEERAFDSLRKILTTAAINAWANDEAARLAANVGARRAAVAALLADDDARLRHKAILRVVLCFGLVALAFLPLLLMQRTLIKEQKKQAAVCPCCLKEGSLTLKRESQDPRFPELHYLECEGTAGEEGCHYKFRASYQKLPRLCFPAVGVRASGKTHWLVTAYDMVKNHRISAAAAIQNAPALADEEFEAQIEEILENHKSARPTVHSTIPYPLIFHVRDSDHLGKSAAMLNLFDFAGEMMSRQVNTDLLRQRALLMDGFVLFLDPTQVTKRKGGLSIKDQVQALGAFHQEMRDMRELDVGTPIPAPVAVCISKLDLVTTQSPFGGAARPWVQAVRETFTKPPSLALLQKRSRLCEEALQVMFPGWELTRTLSENFGGRFLFFPMTPVGLEESELGVSDLSKRTFAPVGIVEPILWLLHMHGYCIF